MISQLFINAVLRHVCCAAGVDCFVSRRINCIDACDELLFSPPLSGVRSLAFLSRRIHDHEMFLHPTHDSSVIKRCDKLRRCSSGECFAGWSMNIQ